jgi:hypothetical protein
MRGIHENLPRRCEHGCYKPTDVSDSAPNPVCSICKPIPASLALTKREWKEIASKESLKNV